MENEFDEYLIDAKLHIKTIGRIEDYANDDIYPYEPTSYSVLDRLAKSGLITEADHLLDYGCGKGRTLIYLQEETGCKASGVELMGDFYQMARSNVESYEKNVCRPAGKKCRIDFTRCEAQKYEIPDSVNRIFFFNPFSVEIFESVMTRVVGSYYEKPREILLFLYYPQDAYVAGLSTMDEVMFSDEIDCMDLFPGKDKRNRVMIFQLGGDWDGEYDSRETEDSLMDSGITMSVSSMTRKGDQKAIYILFREGEKSAEISLPECKVIRNDGFDQEQISQLCDYVDGQRETIYEMARQINPVKALMK